MGVIEDLFDNYDDEEPDPEDVKLGLALPRRTRLPHAIATANHFPSRDRTATSGQTADRRP